MTETKKHSKPYRNRRYSRRNQVRISPEELESALKAYYRDGGKVIKVEADERLMKDIPIHFEDNYYG